MHYIFVPHSSSKLQSETSVVFYNHYFRIQPQPDWLELQVRTLVVRPFPPDFAKKMFPTNCTQLPVNLPKESTFQQFSWKI